MTVPKKQRCPICGKSETPAQKPFCSQGCRDRDLLQWLGDGYRIPGPPADPNAPHPGLDSTHDPD